MEGAEKVIPTEKIAEMARHGYALAPLEAGDIAKLGALSSVNYMALPGGKPLDDPSYRVRDWTPDEGKFIAARQADYDGVKAAAAIGPGAPAATATATRPVVAPPTR
jgi:hypothetical protein